MEKNKNISVSRQKEILVEILSEFDMFCREHNIKYSIAGGTLLGAVRHHGFIPWDDDVDVFMLREEYEKFIHLYIDTNRFELKCYERDNTFKYPFAKLVDKTTILIEDVNNPEEIGLYLDIFPMDNCPGSYKEACDFLKKIRFYLSLKILKQVKINNNRSVYKNLTLIIGRIVTALVPIECIVKKDNKYLKDIRKR